MPSLLALPSELLARIARELPCSSLLQLILVNHELHAACYHRIIFKDIAEYSLLDVELPHMFLSTEERRWKDSRLLLENASFEDTIRVAYAVEQAIKMVNDRDPPCIISNDDNTILRYVRNWLPQFLISRYPVSIVLNPAHFFGAHLHLGSSQATYQPTDTDRFNFGFCLTYLLLERLSTAPHGTDFRPYQIYQLRIGETVHEPTLKLLTQELPESEIHSYTINKAQACSLLAPMVLLIESMKVSNFEQMWIKCPRPDSIPFTSYMKLPPVHRSTSAEAFAACYTERMTTIDFLSGCWIGWFAENSSSGHEISWQLWGPVEPLDIVARPPDRRDRPADNIKAIIDRASQGQDGNGSFNLYGEVYQDGQVDFVKCYTTNVFDDWFCRGRVTPFGITGFYGTMGGDIRGCFWIWKEEWSS